MSRWPILVLGLVCLGCSEDKKSDLADSVSGPGIEVHCAAALPRGVGDTSVDVTCPPAAAAELPAD